MMIFEAKKRHDVKSFDKKKHNQDKMEHSIYEMFRLKLKLFSVYKNHDVRIVERPSI